MLHTIFFLLAGQKVDLFAPHRAIKSTLWPASRKNIILLQEQHKNLIARLKEVEQLINEHEIKALQKKMKIKQEKV